MMRGHSTDARPPRSDPTPPPNTPLPPHPAPTVPQVHTFPAFPTSYPTSALLGCVTITDCLSQADYASRFPSGEPNDSAHLFVASSPRTLALPMRISGQHKLWSLPTEIAKAAREALRPSGATWDARPSQTAATGGGHGTAAAAAAGGRDPSCGDPGEQFDLYEGVLPTNGPASGTPRALSLVADRRKRCVVLQDGMVLLRGALDLTAQQAVVDLVREIGVGPAGFYTPRSRGGTMHLRMMCLGWHWDSVTQRYGPTRSNLDGGAVAPLPPELWALVQAAAHTATEACASVPSLEPGVCLVNHYGHSGRLGMHQDRSESPATLRRGSPVVSISIGDAAEFSYSATRPEETDAASTALGGGSKVQTVRLDSGDVLIFGGPARMLFHAVGRILPNHRPKSLRMASGRLNLTFREI